MAGIVCLIRRICLLREQGEVARAEQLQAGELAEALTALREADGPEACSAVAVAQVFAREEERIADAQVLAELLAPRLGAARPATTAPLPAAAPPPSPPGRAPGVPAESLSIPDLLDAMLAAERTSPRTRR